MYDNSIQSACKQSDFETDHRFETICSNLELLLPVENLNTFGLLSSSSETKYFFFDLNDLNMW